MNTCISEPFDPNEKINILRLEIVFYLANRQNMILAMEEAVSLLKILREYYEMDLPPDNELEISFAKICYDFSFGRIMTDEEEMALLNFPNQILIDD
jgi:hypothetical protein